MAPKKRLCNLLKYIEAVERRGREPNNKSVSMSTNAERDLFFPVKKLNDIKLTYKKIDN